MKNDSILNDLKTLQKLKEIRIEEDKTLLYEDSSSSFSCEKNSFKRIFKKMIDDFYPPRCYMCGKNKVNYDTSLVCDDCIEIYKQYKVCKYFYDEEGKEIGLGVYRYDGVVRYLVQRLKFNKDKKVAYALAELSYSNVREFLLRHHVNYFVPIPIHKDRLKERGFNQSELIAKRFYEKSGVPYRNDVVGRTRYTIPQSKTQNKDRAKNIEGSFEVLNKDEVFAKDILVVDDIYTTGATINECVKTLYEAGARRVYFMTVGVSNEQLKNEKNEEN